MKKKKHPPKSEAPNSQNRPLNQYIKYSTIGFQMAIIIAGGAFLGQYIDQQQGWENHPATIVLSLLSIFLALFLALRELLKKDPGS